MNRTFRSILYNNASIVLVQLFKQKQYYKIKCIKMYKFLYLYVFNVYVFKNKYNYEINY